jgi:hypothetical protein
MDYGAKFRVNETDFEVVTENRGGKPSQSKNASRFDASSAF